MKISLPTLHVQRKIAAVLSAYDDLIENNTRRIAILEEMARLIYREWFVHFRFPGREEVEMVEVEGFGLVPSSWDISTLGEISKINMVSIKPGNAPKHIHYINISSVSEGRINFVETMGFSDAPSRARRVVRHGDIIWSTVRPNRRSYSLILDPIPNTIVSTGFAVISPHLIPFSYIYYAVTTDEFVGYLSNRARGSAYPAVNTTDFEGARVLIPPELLVRLFHRTVIPMIGLKKTLLQKNEKLRQNRDLLLPKLISGELNVSELNIVLN